MYYVPVRRTSGNGLFERSIEIDFSSRSTYDYSRKTEFFEVFHIGYVPVDSPACIIQFGRQSKARKIFTDIDILAGIERVFRSSESVVGLTSGESLYVPYPFDCHDLEG